MIYKFNVPKNTACYVCNHVFNKEDKYCMLPMKWKTAFGSSYA